LNIESFAARHPISNCKATGGLPNATNARDIILPRNYISHGFNHQRKSGSITLRYLLEYKWYQPFRYFFLIIYGSIATFFDWASFSKNMRPEQ